MPIEHTWYSTRVCVDSFGISVVGHRIISLGKLDRKMDMVAISRRHLTVPRTKQVQKCERDDADAPELYGGEVTKTIS